MWELTHDTLPLLARHGFAYDAGLMDADHPYLLATSEAPGAPAIVELPGHWSLDDWEPYNYLPGITGSGVIASPDEVVGRWTLELEALVAEGGLFMLTNHPFVSGRASRAAALEGLIARAKAIDGLWIATAAEIAAHTASLGLEPVVHRRPIVRASVWRSAGARRPGPARPDRFGACEHQSGRAEQSVRAAHGFVRIGPDPADPCRRGAWHARNMPRGHGSVRATHGNRR